ncbi:MAG: hypothetical protein Q8Q09_06900 [Deltaproteobacteria bacterium]|nr:hypothetical protein [Deltaproteobacteria bacterium]
MKLFPKNSPTRWLPLLGLALAACSPPPVSGDAAADADASSPTDARADAPPEASLDVSVPDVEVPDAEVPDAEVPDVEVPDAEAPDATPGMDATVEAGPGMDAAMEASAPDASPDASRPDASPDASPDAGPACPMPTGALTLPMGTVMGMLGAMPAGFNNRLSCASATFSSNEAVYTLNVTSRTGLVLSTNNAATMFDTGIAVRTVCTDVNSEVMCDDDGANGGGLKSYARGVLEPGMYTVIVDGVGASGGAYQLDVSSFTPAANATCAAPTALTAGATAMGSTANGGTTATPCTNADAGGQVFYSFSIPANSRVSFAVTATGAQNVVARVVDSCAATAACLGNATTTAMGTAVNVTSTNATAMPRTVIVAVASTSQTADGAFTITPMVSALPANANCAAPTALTMGSTAMGDTTAGGGAPIGCNTTEGPGLFYSVTVPANTRATLTTTRTGTQSVRVRVLDSCTAMTCVASTLASSAAPVTTDIVNSSAAARTYLVEVGSSSASVPAQFTVALTGTSMVAANASCATAQTIAASTMVTGDTAVGGDRPTTCVTGGGAQLFYSVTVPANQRGTLTLTRGMGAPPQDVVMRVLDTCTSTTCAANATTSGATAQTLTLSNLAMMPRTYLVSVSSSTTTAATFSLGFATSSLPYAVTRLEGQTCEALPMGAAPVMGVANDDSASAYAALPFTLNYFGAPAGAYYVSSNGHIVLAAAGMTGAGSSSSFNSIIPTGSAPNGVLAAFWDDLAPTTAGMGVVRTGIAGMMPSRRFIAQWDAWTFFSATSPRVTFQIKLHETTNVIEFVYCDVTPGMDMDRATGNSATIGIENLAGTEGIPVSFNTAGAVQTGSLIRFTPM